MVDWDRPGKLKVIKRKIKRFFVWIIKSFQYSKFLWHDHDWSYKFILRVLKYKIERTRKSIKKNNILLHGDMYCEQMQHCEKLLEKLMDEENYLNWRYKKHDEKWGEDKWIEVAERFEGQKCYRVTKQNCHTPEEEKQQRKEMLKLFDDATKEELKDWDELFDCLKNNMRYWWD